MIHIESTTSESKCLTPNKTDISAHLYALFDPAFVQQHPDSWIEIAYGKPAGKLNAAGNFSAFELEKAAAFAESKNKAGYNVYVGAALRHGAKPESGRANGDRVLDASHAWAEYDGAGDNERIRDLLKTNNLAPAVVVTTGTTPHVRRHLYFTLAGTITPDKVEAANTALCELLGSDNVQDAPRVMRLAGTINYPKKDKAEKGYVTELVTLQINKDARAYRVDELTKLAPGAPLDDPYLSHSKESGGPGASDEELIAILKSVGSAKDKWHKPMLKAVNIMIGRGWPDSAIKVMCAQHCDGGVTDPDLEELIESGRKKFAKPNVEIMANGHTDTKESDVERLNKKHAVLPIGGKTRVVTFGELPDFPGLETIVMTQTIDDFKALQNKYRHTWRDKDGDLKSSPLGSYWISSGQRRQYDGGMAFMPHHDGDFGNKLNLWRGFGFKPTKAAPGSRAEIVCRKFLDFMRDIICSGDEEHFDYLVKREATILQKRIRSEIALGLRTTEEGCGKGFYEFTMGRLLGKHSMQVNNPEHIIGKFNPHLETLLRLTADEALFVGNHHHRNTLFGLITEPTLTIEPKGCGLYQADSYLNLSITSNADHFLPISGTARRFFIPTVSTKKKGDVDYFNDLRLGLEAGGYEALLYYLLHEVDLTGFNVRKVPQTAGLREQRDHGLEPLDAWWVELLETGTLMGSDPAEPNRAVSNAYQREIEGGYGAQSRYVNQRGLYDQAKLIEPRLRNLSDHKLGRYLTQVGGDNSKKVLRKQGWSFPPLDQCRAAWLERYPKWTWRNPDITEWQPEEADDVVIGGPRLVVDNDDLDTIRASIASGRTRF